MGDLLRYRDDAATGAPVLSLADFLAADNAVAVRIEPGEDARKLLPHLGRIALVEVNFPAYGDGRGYSSARILREEGYTGELRAVGDVLLDQLSHMKRCGFDAFAPAKPIAPEAAEAAFATWPDVYQKTVDGRSPIWALRHGR
ncbi:DUF934 domain-containing protein [Novosphingobium sp. PASSN1]|uniref:DUF934 domain-containing protein n=1 Tax=Novosphingobium sp. PASSN1 TaxID=2015561 RepID=UPI000BD91F71|nr:DUF934 domain-containing protein [Novosphingobium sp. PASSN1]OYU36134.1 MAG: oxidoreductase [Novosphingobium sp. PASSN1]